MIFWYAVYQTGFMISWQQVFEIIFRTHTIFSKAILSEMVFQRIYESIEFKFNQFPILTFDFFSCNNYAMSMSNISGLISNTISLHSVRWDSNLNRYLYACMQNFFIHLIILFARFVYLFMISFFSSLFLASFFAILNNYN